MKVLQKIPMLVRILCVAAIGLLFAAVFFLFIFNHSQKSKAATSDQNTYTIGACTVKNSVISSTVCTSNPTSLTSNSTISYSVLYSQSANAQAGQSVSDSTATIPAGQQCTTLTYDTKNVAGNYVFGIQQSGGPCAALLCPTYSSTCTITSSQPLPFITSDQQPTPAPSSSISSAPVPPIANPTATPAISSSFIQPTTNLQPTTFSQNTTSQSGNGAAGSTGNTGSTVQTGTTPITQLPVTGIPFVKIGGVAAAILILIGVVI